MVYKNEGLYANGTLKGAMSSSRKRFASSPRTKKKKLSRITRCATLARWILDAASTSTSLPEIRPKVEKLYCMNTSVTDKNANVALVRVPAAKGEGTITVEAKAKSPSTRASSCCGGTTAIWTTTSCCAPWPGPPARCRSRSSMS